MSTSTSTSTSTHHPLPLREQAFALYCEGLHSPAIAQQLRVPERTVRAWIARANQSLADERHGTSQAAAALAEARQLRIAAAAWESYHRHAAAEQRQLDELQFATHQEFDAQPPRLTAAGSRYLALAQRATALASKFAGAHTCPPPQPAGVDFRMLIDKPGPESYTPPMGPGVPPLTGLALEQYQHQMFVESRAGQIEADLAQLAKARARLAEINALLSPTSTDEDDRDEHALHDAYEVEQQHGGSEYEDGGEDGGDDTGDAGDPAAPTAAMPAESATAPTGAGDFPAESATSPTLLCSSVSSVVDSVPPAESATLSTGDPVIPAKTATAADGGLAAGIQPANPTLTIPSPPIASATGAAPSLGGKGVGG